MSAASWLSLPILLTAAIPLAYAWRANAGTTLRHALAWAAGAWIAWLLASLAVAADRLDLAQPVRYLGLCLTGCAGVAVLGARRPGVGPWNFVVLGLLVTLLLPIARGLGEVRLDTAFLIFLATALGVGVFNYLPTRFGPSAFLLGAACVIEFLLVTNAGNPVSNEIWPTLTAALLLAAGPWTGFFLLATRRRTVDAFDAIWLDFRDRFGVVWSQRLREQFNRAADNASWPTTLSWFGLARRNDALQPDPAELLAALSALTKRFITPMPGSPVSSAHRPLP